MGEGRYGLPPERHAELEAALAQYEEDSPGHYHVLAREIDDMYGVLLDMREETTRFKARNVNWKTDLLDTRTIGRVLSALEDIGVLDEEDGVSTNTYDADFDPAELEAVKDMLSRED